MDDTAIGKIEKGVDKNIDESYHLILQPISKPVSIFYREVVKRPENGKGVVREEAERATIQLPRPSVICGLNP